MKKNTFVLFTIIILTLLFHISLGQTETTTTTDTLTTTTPAPTCDVSVNPTLSFSAVNAGSTSSDVSTTLNNVGNSIATLSISGSDWVSGQFDASQTHWDVNPITDFGGNPLSSTPVQVTDNFDPLTSLTLHFVVQIPAHQSSGSYSQTITVTVSC